MPTFRELTHTAVEVEGRLFVEFVWRWPVHPSLCLREPGHGPMGTAPQSGPHYKPCGVVCTCCFETCAISFSVSLKILFENDNEANL